MENVKLLVLMNGQILVSQIDEVPSELGEPDCKLTQPYEVVNKDFLEPWHGDYTLRGVFMIHSTNIVTITDPKPTLLEKYQTLIK